jgi:hypothetical protein
LPAGTSKFTVAGRFVDDQPFVAALVDAAILSIGALRSDEHWARPRTTAKDASQASSHSQGRMYPSERPSEARLFECLQLDAVVDAATVIPQDRLHRSRCDFTEDSVLGSTPYDFEDDLPRFIRRVVHEIAQTMARLDIAFDPGLRQLLAAL